MNGYSKIKPSSNININNNNQKTRSVDISDFSDFSPFPQTLNPARNPETVAENQIKVQKPPSTSPERKIGGGNAVDDARGERFGVVLGRSVSVSSSSSLSASGFQIQTTVKRAFSMRRSSSVSERYCRIHDQYMALGEGIEEEEEEIEIAGRRRSVKKKQKGSKIIRACKRLLGL